MPWESGNVYAPHLEPGAWLNSAPQTLAALLRRGPVLVDVWDYSCVNCLRTLPYLIEWHERYAPLGLTILGIHTPEFDFARAPEAVAAAVARLALPYPVLVDSARANWSAFATRAWPTKFLIDRARRIRYQRRGEGAYGETETALQTLLREQHGAGLALPAPLAPLRPTDAPGAVCYPVTPELYAGWAHGRLGNAPDWERGVGRRFVPEPTRAPGRLYFEGRWRPEVEYAEALEAGARLRVPYLAAEINGVLGTADGEPRRLTIEQDGQPLGLEDAGEDVIVDSELGSYVQVRAPRLFNLVINPDFAPHEVALESVAPGLRVYAFSFVSCVRRDSG